MAGESILVLEGVQAPYPGSLMFTLGGDGSLAYIPDSVGMGELSEGALVWVNRQGLVTPVTDHSARYHHQPRLSPDGTRLAAVIGSDEGSNDIWIYHLERGTRLRLTSEGTINHRPVWTPDGSAIIFQSNRTDAGDLFSKPADGSGPAEQLLHRVGSQYPESYSPEHVLTIQEGKGGTNVRDIWGWPPDGRFLMIEQGRLGDDEHATPPHIVVVENWYQELLERLATEN